MKILKLKIFAGEALQKELQKREDADSKLASFYCHLTGVLNLGRGLWGTVLSFKEGF